ncbi:MAG: hypothetical protein QOE07_1623 [Acidimicrobiaceae bacterium]|jgi:hypothetical protein|nr:hypothetical protein [Acidimicrobiaceae bacterium]
MIAGRALSVRSVRSVLSVAHLRGGLRVIDPVPDRAGPWMLG